MKKLIITTALFALTMAGTAYAQTEKNTESGNFTAKEYIINMQGSYNNLSDKVNIGINKKICGEQTTQVVIKPECTTKDQGSQNKPIHTTTEATTQVKPICTTTEATTEV
ncbi:MAG: hypothetical protein Q4F63_07045, partial [Clostridia bacterium]|nr:hypothetical protein [Clostridia bacterium]